MAKKTLSKAKKLAHHRKPKAKLDKSKVEEKSRHHGTGHQGHRLEHLKTAGDLRPAEKWPQVESPTLRPTTEIASPEHVRRQLLGG